MKWFLPLIAVCIHTACLLVRPDRINVKSALNKPDSNNQIFPVLTSSADSISASSSVNILSLSDLAPPQSPEIIEVAELKTLRLLFVKWTPHPLGETSSDPSDACTLAIASLPTKLVGNSLVAEGNVDLTACYNSLKAANGLKPSVYSRAEGSIYLSYGCEAMDLSAYVGKAIPSDIICKTKSHEFANFKMVFAGKQDQGNGEMVDFNQTILSSSSDANNAPCTVTVSNSDLLTTNCVEILKVRDEIRGTVSYERYNSNNLSWRKSENFYLSGTKTVELGNWTGKITFIGDNNPSFSFTNGTTKFDGRYLDLFHSYKTKLKLTEMKPNLAPNKRVPFNKPKIGSI